MWQTNHHLIGRAEAYLKGNRSASLKEFPRNHKVTDVFNKITFFRVGNAYDKLKKNAI